MKILLGLLFTSLFLVQYPSSVAAGENCIPTDRLRTTKVLDSETILFRMNGKKTYINRLPSSCPGLGIHQAFSYKTRIQQLCSSDIIRVFHGGGLGGSYLGAACGLGKFEVYVEPSEGVEAASS